MIDLQRVLRKGADHKNYRRTLNRAYLVLSLIWIFAGLIHPLYQADQSRAFEAAQLDACIHAALGNDMAVQTCYERDGSIRLARDPMRAFRGHVRRDARVADQHLPGLYFSAGAVLQPYPIRVLRIICSSPAFASRS